jgi:ribosomal protein S18 acetylase RimI-like enzyme
MGGVTRGQAATIRIGLFMTIIVCELNEQNIQDVNKCDGTFTVDSKIILQAEKDDIRYTVVSVLPYQKRYPSDEIDYTTYLAKPDKTIYFAYMDRQLAGQIILRKNWNQYAYVEDIAVDIHFRKCGVGRTLVAEAIDWAKTKLLAGIMLETQNNNVAACRFYERCGFKLGGFDRYLYKGISKNTEEIALYWYLLL